MFKAHRDTGNEVLEVENLSKSYDGEIVFENLTFQITKDENNK